MTECSICVETFNKSSHSKCVCPNCDYTSCRTCVQTYILTLEDSTISCMSCKKNWTINTLDEFITKTFRNNELKKHREKTLLDREMSLLPATQQEAQRAKNINEYRALLKIYTIEQRAISNKIDELNNRLHRIYMRQDANLETTTKEKIHFTIHCPFETCKGFVASNNWKCGLCNTPVCKKCHEKSTDDDTHVCIESNVETAKLIKKDSKSCPGCATLIFKITGCNQMWCTQCHTTFSWDTGNIVNGNIHNPHFYEWVRRNGEPNTQRVFGDVPCGGIISLFRLKQIIPDKDKNTTTFIYNTHRIVLDIQHVKMPFYRTDPVLNNIDLRIRFLLDIINESDFKVTLQQREKKMIRYREIYDVLEMFLFTLIDMFNNLTTDVVKIYPIFEKDVIALREFGNDQLYKISKRYNCTVPILADTIGTIKY